MMWHTHSRWRLQHQIWASMTPQSADVARTLLLQEGPQFLGVGPEPCMEKMTCAVLWTKMRTPARGTACDKSAVVFM